MGILKWVSKSKAWLLVVVILSGAFVILLLRAQADLEDARAALENAAAAQTRAEAELARAHVDLEALNKPARFSGRKDREPVAVPVTNPDGTSGTAIGYRETETYEGTIPLFPPREIPTPAPIVGDTVRSGSLYLSGGAGLALSGGMGPAWRAGAGGWVLPWLAVGASWTRVQDVDAVTADVIISF